MKSTMFKDEMFQAVLDLRKTETRRLNGLKEINKNPHWYKEVKQMCVNEKGQTIFAFKKHDHWIDKEDFFCMEVDYAKSPYKVGDVIGIKENFYIMKLRPTAFHYINFQYNFGREYRHLKLTDNEWSKYRKWKNQTGSKSKLFMFESLIRNKIKITDIRIERINDISDQDCIKEGIKLCFYNALNRGRPDYNFEFIRGSFIELWDSINKSRGYGWDKNNWVFVYVFELLK